MYKKLIKKPKKFDFDVIIIGSGAGGGVAAHILAKQGKRVAIVEKEKYGGECPNYGCVPTKSLLQTAETVRSLEDANKFGVEVKDYSLRFNDINSWRASAVANTGVTEGKSVYGAEGITTIDGSAHFVDPWRVSINSITYSAKNFLIAAGTHSAVPNIPGIQETGFITYREAIDLPTPPKSLLIIGGGAIGCEFAEIFSSFGTKVTIIENRQKLIAKEDSEVGDLIEALFEQKGISVSTEANVISVTKKGSKKSVLVGMQGKNTTFEVDEILLTAGKIPNTDLGLENAGVKYSNTGIDTNLFMQTSAKHIYAAGDVTGKYMYTHTAAYQSRIAAFNMFKSKKVRAKYHAVPRCVFTFPEIAAVGMTETQVKEQKIPYQIGAVPISVIGRANTSSQRNGFVKVIASHTGIVLGGVIVAPRAGEMIHELSIAVHHGMKADTITEVIHAFPTWSEAVRIACQKIHCQ
jgi:dihydrolipoamide dehydrogenase